jgi:hypothetical protein
MKRTIKSTHGRGGNLMESLEERRMFAVMEAPTLTTSTHEMTPVNQPALLVNPATAPASAMDDPSIYYKPRPTLPVGTATVATAFVSTEPAL